MPKPHDDAGQVLPPAHKRLAQSAAIIQTIVFDMVTDARSAHLTLIRRQGLAQRAIDNIMDGARPPAWIFAQPSQGHATTILPDLWRRAVELARAELAKVH